jgi:acylphosphatase
LNAVITASVNVRIYGRVQGVGFRYSLLDQAGHLGLKGWVRNRRDGSVEAVAQGAASACEALARWAQRGPSAARVERVEIRVASESELALITAGFTALPTV